MKPFMKSRKFLSATIAGFVFTTFYMSTFVSVYIPKLTYFNESYRYIGRFWYLAQSSYPNASFEFINQSPNQKPLYQDFSVDNLWRPEMSNVSFEGNVNDRIIQQYIWQMEAEHSNLLKDLIKPKTILLMDGFKWWWKEKWVETGQNKVSESDCSSLPGSIISNCTFTENVTVERPEVIVSGRGYGVNLPLPNNSLFVYYILESQYHSGAVLTRDSDILASFWGGSDIVTHKTWIYYDPQVLYKEQDHDYWQGKSKPVAIFVSNCQDQNNRMGYVHELRKHIKVDVYGQCDGISSLKCERSESQKCFDMLKADYYFYLSFENSNCRDYITEKLVSNALDNDIIPIVLGAHPDDYRALAPYKSYLHVEDYESPKMLAEYIKVLMNDGKKYNEYFAWKGTGTFVGADFLCRICAMAYYADLVPPPKRRKKFNWNAIAAVDNGLCLPKGEWYWTRKTVIPASLDNRTESTNSTNKDIPSRI